MVYRVIRFNILDVGCGKCKRGDIGLDFDKECNPDVLADAHNLPFKSNIFNVVICSHVLEHSSRYSEILMEIHRVLKDNGMVDVYFPNFRSWQTLKFWLKGEVNEPLFHYRSELDHHRVCFTPSKMKKALEENCFKPLKIEGEFRHFKWLFNLLFPTLSQNLRIKATKHCFKEHSNI
jgi:ubiquinone/menaquinone biosynthesis C-methylase UbiE